MTSNLALFVDAGYLFKQGSEAVFGEVLARHEISLDAAPFLSELTAWLRSEYPAESLLRTYWYDGARRGIPGPDQLVVAGLPYVKLRLGRINSAGQQKGVDTLIVRDLMVLSLERTIHRAVVLSGDEDLREGVEYVQDRGVRVTVLGIEASGRTNQSTELLREADHTMKLPNSALQKALTRLPVLQSATPTGPTTTAPLDASAEVSAVGHMLDGAARSDAITDAVTTFVRQWAAAATPEEFAALMQQRPSIPQHIDAALLRSVVRATGQRDLDGDTRRRSRRAFWESVAFYEDASQAASSPTPPRD
ncbi:MAG: NYN domain-containing protein [Actinomycetota bacterium]|nr:NYN domain-containing protein [Actinomycetota bacterium]